MKPLATLTLNPAIDSAAEADVVHPTRKIRTFREIHNPGGGGINVARVVHELGSPTVPTFLSGGATGAMLDAMLREMGMQTLPVAISGLTRISHAVFERTTGLEYRFVSEGPYVGEAEWQRCLEAIEALDCDYLVASGSLPRGLRADCYAEVAQCIARKGGRFVLDTSGPALAETLATGNVYLAKPSLGELQALVGHKLTDAAARDSAAREIVDRFGLQLLAVTMGHEGALLASPTGILRLRPPELSVKSATGAGDSFLGAMVYGLMEGREAADAFALGVAAGSATVLTPGTGLCQRADVWHLYRELVSGTDRAS